MSGAKRRRRALSTLTGLGPPWGGTVASADGRSATRGYRFPSEVIQHGVWPYLRFTLSFRDVEDLLAERGIIVFLRFSRPVKLGTRFSPGKKQPKTAMTDKRRSGDAVKNAGMSPRQG